jgi:opacity protein-like surface antigen
MTRIKFGLLWMLSVSAGAAVHDSAFAADLTGVYVGGNFARARNEFDTSSIDRELVSEAQSNGDTISFSRKSVKRLSDVWWADAGYFFTPYVALDAAYLHLGQIRYVAVGNVTNATGTPGLSSTNELTSGGPALSMILRLPIVEAFEVDLRLGDYFGKTAIDSGITVGSNSSYQFQSRSGSSLLAGVGAAYALDAHWLVRLDYLRINDTGDSSVTGRFSVNLASAGVSFIF